jgi:hypothetical protein
VSILSRHGVIIVVDNLIDNQSGILYNVVSTISSIIIIITELQQLEAHVTPINIDESRSVILESVLLIITAYEMFQELLSRLTALVQTPTAYSWTQGNQSDLKHEGLIATGGFSEVHKVCPFSYDGILKRIDEKSENWKGG